MPKFSTLEQVEAARRKREGVFEKARAMHGAGQISDAEFRVLEEKFQQKMEALDRAAAALGGEAPAPPAEPAPDAAPAPAVEEPAPEPAFDLPPPEQGALAANTDPLADTDPEGSPPLEQLLAVGSEPPLLDEGGPEDVITSPPPPAPPEGGEEVAAFDDGADEGDDPFGSEGPPVGLEEMTEMSGDLGAAPAPAPAPAPAVGFGTGDSDLLSLVKPAPSAGGDDDIDGLRIQLQTERTARQQAEKEARNKEQDARDLNAAFRRTVDEKDLIGQRAEAVRISYREYKQNSMKVVGVLAGVCVLALFRGECRSGKLQDALRQAKKAHETRTRQLEGEIRTLQGLQGEVDDLRSRLGRKDTAITSLEREVAEARDELDSAHQEIARLQEESMLPGGGEGGGAALDPDQLYLLASARLDDLKSLRQVFLDGLAMEDYPFASELVAALEAREGEYVSALEEMVAALLDGTFDPALEAGETLVGSASESHYRAAALVGRLYLAYGNTAAALPHLEVLRGVEGYLDARLALAEAYLKLKRREAAREDLAALLGKPDLSARQLVRLGVLAERALDGELAARAYEAARAKDPSSTQALVALSGIAIEGADFARARQLLEEAARARPEALEIQYNLALAYLGLKDRAGAEGAIQKLRDGRWREVDVRDLETRLSDLPAVGG